MQAVERAAQVVGEAFQRYADRFVQRVMRDVVPGLIQDAKTVEQIWVELNEPKVSAKALEGVFKVVDKASSDDLRVMGVRTGSVVRGAHALQSQWVRQNTDLVRGTARLRERVRRTVDKAVREGRSVDEIRKALEEQVGIERSRAELVARDQTLKLYGQIQEQRQRAAGFTQYVWTTSLDERVRPGHAVLDGAVIDWDDPPIVDPRTGRRAHPGGDFQCLPSDSQVAFASPVDWAFRRWYCGQATLLVTDSGEALQCTPNHPVLTASGWKPAQAVQVGEYVLKARLNGRPVLEADVQNREAAISDIFEALALVFGFGRQRTVAPEFHYDASTDEQVDVVDVDRELLLDLEALSVQQLRQLAFANSDATRRAARDGELVLAAVGAAAYSGVGGLRQRLALFFGRCREAGYVGRTAPTRLHALTDQECANRCPRNSVALSEAFDRGTLSLQVQAFVLREWLGVVRPEVNPATAVLGDVALAEAFRVAAQVAGDVRPGTTFEALTVRVAQNRVSQLDCHVYNVSSACDWYVAQRLFVHNCRCSAVPFVDPEDA